MLMGAGVLNCCRNAAIYFAHAEGRGATQESLRRLGRKVIPVESERRGGA